VRSCLGHPWFGQICLVRLALQRGMGAVYFIAFLAVLRQFKPLLGERGLLPVPAYLEKSSLLRSPSIFFWRYSDRLLDCVAWTGLAISACAICGLTEAGPAWLSMAAWLLLWVLYLSIVNVGQTFFAFGWESMLLEAGFFTAFLGPAHMQPPIVPVLVLRWMLFRTEVGAGLIKLRHDECWRKLTCLYYHYETQPLPNPLSWYFHHIPAPLHRFSALFSHFVQIVVPFALFAPQPAASVATGLIVLHQLVLIVSGNYSWLNWLTVVLGVSGCSDSVLARALPFNAPAPAPRPQAFDLALYALGVMTALLSIRPALNLLSRNQAMNRSYNPLHLVNAYGAFGQVGRERYEIVIEGASDRATTPATEWREYGFKAKPGDPMRRPPQVAPYHLRLDWLIWFLPFSVAVTTEGVHVWRYELWFLRFVKKLLSGDAATLKLMRVNPFPDGPPAFIRARFYRYRFTGWREKRESGAWWERRLLGEYLRPVSLQHLKNV
jgi:hypothetical protein